MTLRTNRDAITSRTRTTLKMVAKHVGLTPGTVSAVLNNTPACRSVPERTKQRIFAAARELNYKPDFWARALRMKRTYTIGVIAAQIGDPYGSVIIGGVERYLRESGFFFLTTVHHHQDELLESHLRLLIERGAEGLITIDTSISHALPVPVVAIAGHRAGDGVTNIVIDHRTAALYALRHLHELGHRDIAFMKGPDSSSDAADRWRSIVHASRNLGTRIQAELVVDLDNAEGNAASAPEYGYPFAEKLLRRNRPFTALFAYNDNSAIAAIRVFQDAGLRVPEDVSVVGFDDIQPASYARPALTTVRQPLQQMGEMAACTILDRIERGAECVPEIAIEPQLVVRKSTAPARAFVPEFPSVRHAGTRAAAAPRQE
ncbi:MAG TPA: LacI family DNA-binding transcriptional regulator [Candidatus Acidoferrales bacterium]|nr:LacI family DNA-binding transcriptional regulator [Candidatus Acidoferrales bacterium]